MHRRKAAKIIEARKFPDSFRFVEASCGPLQLEAAEGESGPKRFSMTAYNGGPMNVGFGPPVIVDLAGASVPRQDLPILRQHDPERIVGHSDKITVAVKSIQISDKLSGVGIAAQEVQSLAANGFPWQASIGASIERMEFIDRGESVRVNGRTFNGPLLVARATTLREVSFVPIGADGSTSATVAAQSHVGGLPMFEQWLTAKGFDLANMTEDQKTVLRAAFDAEEAKKAKPDPVPAINAADPVKDFRASLAAEAARVAEVQTIAAKRPTILASAVAEGWTVEKTKTAVLEAELKELRESRPTIAAAHVKGGERMDARVLECALLQAGKHRDVEKQFDDKTLQAAHTAFRGRIGLQQLLLAGAQANGYTGTPYFANDPGTTREVLRAAFSTADVTGIVSNTANKFLLMGYMSVEPGWMSIASKRTVSDFKTVTSYRPTGDFSFEELSGTGEIAHGSMGELSYTNRAKTYAKMFAITREHIVNDDLGALTDVPRALGRGGALKINNVFWTAFLDNSGFFTSGNNNYFDGAATNLQSSSLATGLNKFRKQTDANGHPLGVEPRILLVPSELEVTALELMQSTNYNTGGSSSTDKVPNRNIWAGRFNLVTSSYLSNTNYTGYSTTAWYLLADPMDISCIEVAFLNGVETPVIESADVDFNQLGVQMRGYFDFGVTKQDFRGGVKSKGAA